MRVYVRKMLDVKRKKLLHKQRAKLTTNKKLKLERKANPKRNIEMVEKQGRFQHIFWLPSQQPERHTFLSHHFQLSTTICIKEWKANW